MKQEILKFLTESNLIEGVGQEGLENSVKAYNYLMQIKAPLQKKHILKTHKLLTKGVYPETAGKIRTVQVGIYSGGILTKKCLIKKGLAPEKIEHELDSYLQAINRCKESFSMAIKNNTVNNNNEEQKKGWCEERRIDFKNIHPFEEGNELMNQFIFIWNRKQLGLSFDVVKDKKICYERIT